MAISVRANLLRTGHLRAGIALAFTAFAMLFVTQPAYADRLISNMSHQLGGHRPKGCPSKWCACFLDQMLAKTGFQQLGSNRARDFARYGKKAKPMSVGSIMVMAHHVGVVTGKCADGRIQIVSGNYSRKVAHGCYSARSAIAWRSPVR